MSVEPSPQSVEPAVFKKFLIVTCHNIGGVQTCSIFEKETRLLLPYFTPTYEFHAVSLPSLTFGRRQTHRMKLIRWGEVGQEKPGLLLEDGTRLDASNVVAGYDEKFFEDSGLDTLRRWLDRHESSAPRISSSIRLGPPISRPSKIICIGVNYRDHVAESAAQVPPEPVVFMKATSSLIGPNDPVVIPKNAKKLDWEVELAVVIGKKASYISQEESFESVAGYTR